MTTSRILAAAALSLFAVAGAQAETYEGVTQVNSTLTRAQVQAQAVAAAHAPNQNVTSGSRVLSVESTADRAAVRADTAQAVRNGQIAYGEATYL